MGATLGLITVIHHEQDYALAEAILTRAVTMLAEAKLTDIKQSIRVGRVAAEIVREANEGGYRLVVVGERPAHRLVKRLLGPTAERVIGEMPCPVLIARQEITNLNRVLLCEGGREPSLLERFIEQLSPLLPAIGTLTILHVMSQMAAAPGVPGWELRASAEQLIESHTREGTLLEHDAERLETLTLRPQTKIRHGLVVDEILAEMKEGNYDLVVIGAHQNAGWERFLLDDIAHQIVIKSANPILVV
jgi:nucleotide-binding universal stress UspA family protein